MATISKINLLEQQEQYIMEFCFLVVPLYATIMKILKTLILKWGFQLPGQYRVMMISAM